MEASTLQKKKNTISKGKLKRSIKSVLCRPDELFWPEVTEDERERLESALKKHKIDIPEFKKPHWKDLKLMPKEHRPKPPKLKKVDGLLLGIRECTDSVQNGDCSAILIESKVNPRMIVQPIIERCKIKEIPMLCLADLRKITAVNFGIATSCLGIKCDCLLDLRNEIIDIAKNHPKPDSHSTQLIVQSKHEKIEIMDFDENIEPTRKTTYVPIFPFLYRKDKKTRIFVPTSQEKISKSAPKFIGQDFIEFSEKPQQKNNKAYMKMLLKRISNNPDRVKKK